MSGIEEAIYTLLQNDPAIAALVDDRIWPLERDQGSKLPAITYQRAGGLRDYDMQGATRLVESRFLIMFWGERVKRKSGYKQAKEVLRATVAKFTPEDGFREFVGFGFTLDFTAETYAIDAMEIQGIFINNEDDTRTDGATGTGVTRVFLDCTFWHKET